MSEVPMHREFGRCTGAGGRGARSLFILGGARCSLGFGWACHLSAATRGSSRQLPSSPPSSFPWTARPPLRAALPGRRRAAFQETPPPVPPPTAPPLRLSGAWRQDAQPSPTRTLAAAGGRGGPATPDAAAAPPGSSVALEARDARAAEVAGGGGACARGSRTRRFRGLRRDSLSVKRGSRGTHPTRLPAAPRPPEVHLPRVCSNLKHCVQAQPQSPSELAPLGSARSLQVTDACD